MQHARLLLPNLVLEIFSRGQFNQILVITTCNSALEDCLLEPAEVACSVILFLISEHDGIFHRLLKRISNEKDPESCRLFARARLLGSGKTWSTPYEAPTNMVRERLIIYMLTESS